MRKLQAIVAAGLVAALSAGPAAQSGRPSAAILAQATAFLQQLQHAVDNGDRRTAAAMFTYPASVLASPFNIPVRYQPHDGYQDY